MTRVVVLWFSDSVFLECHYMERARLLAKWFFIAGFSIALLLRSCKVIKVATELILRLTLSGAAGLDEIVPFPVEFVGIDINLLHFFRRDLSSGRVFAAIQPAGYA
jgi:hypothetical protein